MTTYLSLLPEDLEQMIWKKVYSDMIQEEKQMIKCKADFKRTNRNLYLIKLKNNGQLIENYQQILQEDPLLADYERFWEKEMEEHWKALEEKEREYEEEYKDEDEDGWYEEGY